MGSQTKTDTEARRKDLERQLLEAATGRDVASHPLVSRIRRGNCSRESLAPLAQLLYALASRFSPMLATLVAHAPAGEVRAHLIRNLAEEEGFSVIDGALHYVAARRHAELAARFLEAFEEGGGSEPAVESDWLDTQLEDGRWIAVASYLMVGFEGNVPATIAAILPAMREIYRFTGEELVFFTEHLEADREHSRVGAELIARAVSSDEDEDAALEGARRGGQVWWNLMRRCDQQIGSRIAEAEFAAHG